MGAEWTFVDDHSVGAALNVNRVLAVRRTDPADDLPSVGRIVRTNPLEVDSGSLDLSGVAVGDSICVQGVCLTVTAIRAHGFTADVSTETLRVTAGLDRPGAVNLEKSLAVGDKLGGHLVTGHVDGVGEVLSREDGVLAFRLPKPLVKYVALKGSICVDGTSLTVNEVDASCFTVGLVPHTLAVTTLGALAAAGLVIE